jgi:DNA-binding transcriptional ArsR family regulator
MDALQVLAEPQRRKILSLVRDGERAAGEIAGHFDITFGAVSQHLSVLRDAGFVSMRKDGNRRLYSLDEDGLGRWRPVLDAMWSELLDDLAAAVEDSDV